ncbi:MAG: hypothetical protein FWD36_02100 [Treponema sp.]|nr:hypothetical protein [Treponema sp.]
MDNLSRADALIDSALTSSSARDRERFYRQSSNLLRNALEIMDQDKLDSLRHNIENIKSKIKRYEDRHIREFNTGGIEVAYLEPIILYNLLGPQIKDYYPNICGLSLTWFISSNSGRNKPVFNQPYIKFGYLGLNNTAIQKALYIDEAVLYGLFLSVGYQFHLWPTRTSFLFPFLHLGAGYNHFIEYAKDSTAEAYLNFGQLLYEGGLGLKLHIPKANLILAAVAGADMGIGEPISFSVNCSFGLTYLFYGKTKIY